MTLSFVLRAAVPADAAALSLVAGATFLEAFRDLLPGPDIVAHCTAKSSPAAFAEWLGDGDSIVTLAEQPITATPLAYTVLTAPHLPVPTTGEDVELKRIYALASTHGTGLGDALLAQALADARATGRTRMLLGVHPENRRARRFYERHGFVVVGERLFQVGTQTLLDPIYARSL